MKNLAKIISRIFDFYTWFSLLLLVAIFKTGLGQNQIAILLPLLSTIDVAGPVIGFKLLMKSGKISDLDVTKRSERYLWFLLVNALLLVGTIFAFLFGNQLFFILHLVAFILGLTILGITFFYKISAHILMAFGALFIINFLYGGKFIWAFLLTIPIIFARLYLKKHTPSQILAGAVVGLGEPYLLLKLFGLI